MLTNSSRADELPIETPPDCPIRLTIPAKPEYIALARLAMTGLSRLRPLDEEVLGDLKLALTEACSNSVRHAYADGRDGHVQVVYELRRDSVVFEVLDEGHGFELAVSTPREEELVEGGLGIAIIRALADEFEAGERGDAAGSRLRFVKRLE